MSSKLHVVVVCREIPPVGGGAGAVANQLAQIYVHSGHRVSYVTMALGNQFPLFEERSDGVCVHRVECGRKNQDSSYMYEMLRFLFAARAKVKEIVYASQDKERFIIHSHAIIPDGIIGNFAASLVNAPSIITAHGSDVPGYNPDKFQLAHVLMRPVWKKTLAQADAVITPSRHLRSLIHVHAPERDVEVIPNGIYTDLFPELHTEKEREFLVVSRLVRRKGFHVFLEALSKCSTPAKVHIVGDGPERGALEKQAQGLSHDITFYGWLEHGSDSWRSLYERCAYFVFPSESENFPINLLESQLAGQLVIASDIPAHHEVLGEEGALYFPVADSDKLAEILDYCLHQEVQALQGKALALRTRVMTHFSWDAVGEKYLQLLHKYTPLDTGMFA